MRLTLLCKSRSELWEPCSEGEVPGRAEGTRGEGGSLKNRLKGNFVSVEDLGSIYETMEFLQ